MNGEMNAAMTSVNGAYTKIKVLQKQVNELSSDVDTNSSDIKATKEAFESYKTGLAEQADFDTVTIKNLTVNDSGLFENGLTVSGEDLNVTNNIYTDGNITAGTNGQIKGYNLVATQEVSSPKIYASECVQTPNVVSTVELSSPKANITEGTFSKLNVSSETNLTGQTNVYGDMTFNKDNGSSVMSGDYLDIKARTLCLHGGQEYTLSSIGCGVFDKGLVVKGILAVKDLCVQNSADIKGLHVSSTCLIKPNLESPKITGVTGPVTSTTALGLDADGNVQLVSVIPNGENGSAALEVMKDNRRLSTYELIKDENVIATFRYNNDLYYMKQNSTEATNATVSIYKNGSPGAMYTSTYAVAFSKATEGPEYILSDNYIYLVEYDNKHMHAVKLGEFTDKVVSEQSFDIVTISNRVKDKIYFLSTDGNSFIDVDGNTTDIAPINIQDGKIIIASDTGEYIATNSNEVELYFDGTDEYLENVNFLVFNSEDFDSISSDKKVVEGRRVYVDMMKAYVTPVKAPLFAYTEDGATYLTEKTLKTITNAQGGTFPVFTDNSIGIYSVKDTFMYTLSGSSAIISMANTKTAGFMLFNDGLPNGFSSFNIVNEKEAMVTINESGVVIKEGVPLDIRTADITFQGKTYYEGEYFDKIIESNSELYDYFKTCHNNEKILIRNAKCYKDERNCNCYCYTLNANAFPKQNYNITLVFDNKNDTPYLEVINSLSNLGSNSTIRTLTDSLIYKLRVITAGTTINSSTLNLDNVTLGYTTYANSTANILNINSLNNSYININCVCTANDTNYLYIKNINNSNINVCNLISDKVTIVSDNITSTNIDSGLICACKASCLCYISCCNSCCGNIYQLYDSKIQSFGPLRLNVVVAVCNQLCFRGAANVLYPTGFNSAQLKSSNDNYIESYTDVVLPNTYTCCRYITSTTKQIKFGIMNNCYNN